MTPIKILEQYLEDNYGKCEIKYQSGNIGCYSTPKGDIMFHISHDNIISIFKLEHRFGAEEY